MQTDLFTAAPALDKYMNVGEVELHYKRTQTERLPNTRVTCSRDANDVFRIIFDRNTIEYRESAHALFMDNANRVLGYFQVSTGAMNGTIMDVRMIFQTALKLNASALMIAHNHPSAKMQPSRADITITSKVKSAGEILDIKLLDHLILMPDESDYYSFTDEGEL